MPNWTGKLTRPEPYSGNEEIWRIGETVLSREEHMSQQLMKKTTDELEREQGGAYGRLWTE